MATRFDRYYEKQMENANVRAAVEKELASLDLGIQIARAREAKHMNQTQLAAKAGMNASKISRIENSAQNLTLNTSRSQVHQIGIGGTVTRPPLPHHRRCGSAYGGSESYASPSNRRGRPSESK